MRESRRLPFFTSEDPDSAMSQGLFRVVAYAEHKNRFAEYIWRIVFSDFEVLS